MKLTPYALILIVAALLAQGGTAQEIPDGTELDLGATDTLILGTSSTGDITWDSTGNAITLDYATHDGYYHDRKSLPVDFEIKIENAKAKLYDGKVRLSDGDVTLRVVFRSGDLRWTVDLPMERVVKKKKKS